MSKTFVQFAKEVIELERIPLSARQIWEIGKAKGLADALESQGKTPWITIATRINYNISEEKDSSPFIKLGTTRKTFFLKALMASLNQLEIETLNKNADKFADETNEKEVLIYDEKDLHAFLAYYALYHLKAYTKTIKHQKSEKGVFGEWVHPDMVGVGYAFNSWGREVTEFSKQIGTIAVKLFSFEIKKELTFGNLRESFFQAVSNSSWANYGYLIAHDISDDDEFLEELSRLSLSFGIGVIKLELDDPDSSNIILQSKEKEVLDWESINKLAAINPDFQNFLIRINNDIKTNEPRKEEYDKVFEVEELKKQIQNISENKAQRKAESVDKKNQSPSAMDDNKVVKPMRRAKNT